MRKHVLLLACLGMLVFSSGCVSDIGGVKISIPIGDDMTSSTIQQVVCNPPYILVGRECCLDVNYNRVCDRDEQSPDTTVQTATTETTVTYQTVPEIPCSSNSDCNLPEEVKKCVGKTVYLVKTTYKCVNPGTPAAECKGYVANEKQDECGEDESCVDGACVPAGEESTTTLAPAPTTTTTLAPGVTTTTMFSASESTTTTTAAKKSCTSIFHPKNQLACDAGTCQIGYKCTYHSETIVPSCRCDLSMMKATTTTLRMIVVPSCESSFPSCNGFCLTGKECAVKFVTGPGGTKLPTGCYCKTTTTTTSTTIPSCRMVFDPVHMTMVCQGSCSVGRICTKIGSSCSCVFYV